VPDRRVHVVCTYLYARLTGASLPGGAAEAITTIIDHPRKARGLIGEAARKLCAEGSWTCGSLTAILHGMRVSGVASHDWAKPRGVLVLKQVARALYGDGVDWVVDLHYALDCLEQGGLACAFAPPGMLSWARQHCRDLVGGKPT